MLAKFDVKLSDSEFVVLTEVTVLLAGVAELGVALLVLDAVLVPASEAPVVGVGALVLCADVTMLRTELTVLVLLVGVAVLGVEALVLDVKLLVLNSEVPVVGVEGLVLSADVTVDRLRNGELTTPGVAFTNGDDLHEAGADAFL